MKNSIRLLIILLAGILLIDAGVGFSVSNAASKPKHKHKYKVIKLKKPTCTRKGKRILKCKICGKKKKKTLKKLKHRVTTYKRGWYTYEKCRKCKRIVRKYLKKDIPSFWSTEVIRSVEKAETRVELPGYVYFTDTHWNKSAKHSPAIVNYVTDQMQYPFAVFGGDVVTSYHDTAAGAKKEIQDFYAKLKVNVFSTTGNHDDNSNGNIDESTYLSHEDLFSLMYQREENFAELEGQDVFSYTDDADNKIRYISFYYDETEPVPDEIIALLKKRVDELDKHWIVVLFSHAYWHFLKAGTESRPSDYGSKLAEQLLEIQKNSDAYIALWHTGHIHRDYSSFISDKKGENTILVVATSSDCYSKSVKWGGPVMKKGTSTEHIIEIVQIDRAESKVYMTRIGAGKDREFNYKYW